MGTGRRARGGLGPVAAVLPLLNPRQQKAYVVILARGRITRDDYQEIIVGDLPVRTAIYDLLDEITAIEAHGLIVLPSFLRITIELTRPERLGALPDRPMMNTHGFAGKAAGRGGLRVERGVRRRCATPRAGHALRPIG